MWEMFCMVMLSFVHFSLSSAKQADRLLCEVPMGKSTLQLFSSYHTLKLLITWQEILQKIWWMGEDGKTENCQLCFAPCCPNIQAVLFLNDCVGVEIPGFPRFVPNMQSTQLPFQGSVLYLLVFHKMLQWDVPVLQLSLRTCFSRDVYISHCFETPKLPVFFTEFSALMSDNT